MDQPELRGVAPSMRTPARSLPWKRPVDLILGGVALILASPLMAVIALLIRVDTPGAALYRQDRIGRHGVPFGMWKFRSMHEGNDDLHHRMAAAAWFAGVPAPDGYKAGSDPRVTRVGRFLRWTSLDELPQLFNVLRGEMSLVGPRPAIAYELPQYRPWYFDRQLVRPGMTGLWQVSGRDRLTADEMMVLDVRYVRECSAWLDMKILLQTLPALLAGFRGGRQR